MQIGIEVYFSHGENVDKWSWTMLHPPRPGDTIIHDGRWAVVGVSWATANSVSVELIWRRDQEPDLGGDNDPERHSEEHLRYVLDHIATCAHIECVNAWAKATLENEVPEPGIHTITEINPPPIPPGGSRD